MLSGPLNNTWHMESGNQKECMLGRVSLGGEGLNKALLFMPGGLNQLRAHLRINLCDYSLIISNTDQCSSMAPERERATGGSK